LTKWYSTRKPEIPDRLSESSNFQLSALFNISVLPTLLQLSLFATAIMPAPDSENSVQRVIFSEETLSFVGHTFNTPCVAATLEDFYPKSWLEGVATRIEQNKGKNRYNSLRVDFAATPDDPEGETYNLQSLNGDYFSDQPYHAPNAFLIENSTRVYIALMEIQSHFTSRVALKFGFTEEERETLKREAHFYTNQLRPAQKIIVPLFLGIFGTTSEDSNNVVTCLVTRYVGEAIPDSVLFQDLSVEHR
jgi:hypothetical protein